MQAICILPAYFRLSPLSTFHENRSATDVRVSTWIAVESGECRVDCQGYENMPCHATMLVTKISNGNKKDCDNYNDDDGNDNKKTIYDDDDGCNDRDSNSEDNVGGS